MPGLGNSCVRVSETGLFKRQIVDLPFPFSFETALDEQNDVVNGDADWDSQWDFEHTGHRKPLRDSFVCESGYCVDIVSEQDSTLVSGPLQDGAIVCRF